MMLTIAGVLLSLAAGGAWLQRVVFMPNDSRASAEVILRDPDIRGDLITVIANTTSAPTGRTTDEIGTMLETQIFNNRAGGAVMAPTMKQIHSRAIGLNDAPVELTGVQMIDIVRDQRAATAPTVTIPVAVSGTLSKTRAVLKWAVLVCGALGLILAVVGIFMRPTRPEALRSIGESFVALGVSILMFGYVIPVYLFPALDSSSWVHIATRLASAKLPSVLGVMAVSLILGAVIYLSSFGTGRRRTWSTPVAAGRYRNTPRGGW